MGTDAGKVVIENNYLSNITLNNVVSFIVVIGCSNGHANNFRIDTL